MSDDLGWNNIQKHGEQTVMQNYLHDEDKGVREETIFLIFRWNIVLHDSYQADEIVTEIEEWRQKVPGVCVKSFNPPPLPSPTPRKCIVINQQSFKKSQS